MLESPELSVSLPNLAPLGVKRGRGRGEAGGGGEEANLAQILWGDKCDSKLQIKVCLNPRLCSYQTEICVSLILESSSR